MVMPPKIKLTPGRPELARRALRKSIKRTRPQKRKSNILRDRRLASEQRRKLEKLARIARQRTLARWIVALRLTDHQVFEIASITNHTEGRVLAVLRACGRIGRRGGFSISKAQHRSLRLPWYVPRMIGKRQRTRQGDPFVREEVLGDLLAHDRERLGLPSFHRVPPLRSPSVTNNVSASSRRREPIQIWDNEKPVNFFDMCSAATPFAEHSVAQNPACVGPCD